MRWLEWAAQHHDCAAVRADALEELRAKRASDFPSRVRSMMDEDREILDRLAQG